MPKRIVPLTDVQVRTAKPKDKEYKLFDGGGLFLLVTPSGGKLWNFKYRFSEKEKKLSLGTYREISLSDARQRREDARKLLANGVDPGAFKKAQKAAAKQIAANSFEMIAREWQVKYAHTWSSGHAATILDRLEKNIFPWIGDKPVSEIKAPDLLEALRRMETRGALDVAHRIRHYCGKVFSLRHCYRTGRTRPGSGYKGGIATGTK